jgi:hypothetical protein
MTDREVRVENQIPRSKISIPLRILCVLCVSSILFSGRISNRTIESTPMPTLPAQFTATPTATRTPIVTNTPTFLPPPSTPSPLPRVNVITLTSTTDENYAIAVDNNILLDATNWTSTAIGPSLIGKINRAVEISGKNNSAGGGANITWRGGMIVGSIPQSWSWRKTHDFGGGGIFIQNDGPIAWQYVRMHNVEDGIKPREAPEYSNTGSWIIHDSYFTAIRDDAIDNDRFEPGTVQDCLFDGVYVFISEQDENVESHTPIGPDEANTIYIKRVYVRLYGTNGNEGAGKWFKWQGDVPHHKLEVSDSVFAIGSEPRLGWTDETTPREVNWIGNNNFILWLGDPGEYGGPKPEGVIFLEGEAARNKWIAVRNKWLTDHGLPPQSLPADYNPHDAPIMQIPAGY